MECDAETVASDGSAAKGSGRIGATDWTGAPFAQRPKSVDPGGVAVTPEKLDRIATYGFKFKKIESFRTMLDMRSHHTTKGIRFTLTSGAGTGPAQHGQR